MVGNDSRSRRISLSVGLVAASAITIGWIAQGQAQVSVPAPVPVHAPVPGTQPTNPQTPRYAPPAPSQTPTSLPRPILTRQQEFSIPYQMTPNHSAREVQLFVSHDQGRHWRLISRGQPHLHSFRYRAPSDGEYSFAIRTLHDGGQHLPPGPMQAELRVVVDTLAPRLDLVAERGDRGEVKVRWQAVDPNLMLKSLTIETRATANEPWKAVAIGQPPPSLRMTRAGEETFFPPAGAGTIFVRASVLDRAGNRSVNQAEVTLSSAAPAPQNAASLVSRLGQASAGRPVPAPRARDGSQTWPPDTNGARPISQ